MDPASLEAANDSFSAVVAVHLFGQLADMPLLLDVARTAPVIEDAAHAPLSYLHGQMAGRFGPAAFYSFASTKYWPAGGGGLAVVHNRDLACKMATLVQKLSPPSVMQEFGSVLLQQAKSAVFSRHLYGVFGKPMRRWAEDWALLEPRQDLKSIQRPHATVACRQTSRFPHRVQLQRANSLRLLSHLGSVDDVVLPRERWGSQYNYHMFPVLLRDRREREAVAASMWKRFVDTSTIYCGVVDECWELGYRGGCPVAESVAGRLLTLPNHAALKGSDVDMVAEVFLSSLEAYRNAGPTYPVLSFGIRSTAGKRETPAPLPSRLRSLAEPPQ
jgi:dTDP-4-amino-4,6-dideoxygalactose transaminase